MSIKIFLGDSINANYAFLTAAISSSTFFSFNMKNKWHYKNNGNWGVNDNVKDLMIDNKISHAKVITLPEALSDKIYNKIINSIIDSSSERKSVKFFDDIMGFENQRGTVYDIIKIIVEATNIMEYLNTDEGYYEMVNAKSENTIIDELYKENDSEYVRLTSNLYHMGLGSKIDTPHAWINYYQILNFMYELARNDQDKFLKVTHYKVEKYEELNSEWVPNNKPEYMQNYNLIVGNFLCNLMSRPYIKFNELFVEMLKYFNTFFQSDSEEEKKLIIDTLLIKASQIIEGDYKHKKSNNFSFNVVSQTEIKDEILRNSVKNIIEEMIHPDEFKNYQQLLSKLSTVGINIRKKNDKPISFQIVNGEIIQTINIKLDDEESLLHYSTNELHMINSVILEKIGDETIVNSQGTLLMNQISQIIRRRQLQI